jgi:hypothetical protein
MHKQKSIDALMNLYTSTKSRILTMPVKSAERKAQEALSSRVKNTLDKKESLSAEQLQEKEKEYTAEYYKA